MTRKNQDQGGRGTRLEPVRGRGRRAGAGSRRSAGGGVGRAWGRTGSV